MKKHAFIVWIGWCLVCLTLVLSAQASTLWSETTERGRRRGRRARPEAFKVFSRIFKQVNSGVVNISTLLEQRGGGPEKEIAELLPLTPEKRKNLGSGILIHRDGYIVTNHHVIKDAVGIGVTLADGRIFKGRVVGTDSYTDIALIKIEDDKPFPILLLGDSSKVEVGEWVLAIGNPFGFNNTMTHGVVSAVGRVISPDLARKRFDNFIQMDASINPGNSGGPLVNLEGEVIGVNAAIAARGMGIAFAVPINQVKKVLGDLHRLGHVPRGWVGIVAAEREPSFRTADKMAGKPGLLIMDVVSGSPAQKAGIRKGDWVTKIDNKPLNTLLELSETISETRPGTSIFLELYRGKKRRQVRIKVEALGQRAPVE